jgi:hypothetical protein
MRIEVYRFCPEGTEDLVMRPETKTLDAPIGALVVAAQCVDGASPISGGFVRLECLYGGVWSPIPDFGCSCLPGFNTSADRRFCTGRLCMHILRLSSSHVSMHKCCIEVYRSCPGGTEDLVMRPETKTLDPPIGALVVAAQCVDGASPISGGLARLKCLQGGVWSPIPDSGCSCHPGFSTSTDRRFCSGRLCMYVLRRLFNA